MKRLHWIGWLLAGLLLAQNAASALAAPSSSDPLEGWLLHYSSGAFYVYHDGAKFAVELASTTDHVIDAIPGASEMQWNSFFKTTSADPNQPPPQPTYCYYCFC
jgi:hypothetical protein